MEKRAIYAGSFDPITLGHIDIIERSAKVFDTVIIGVLINSKKKYLFTIEERIDMIKKELQERNIRNIEIVYYEGLLVDMCKEYNAQTIIRGLRAVTDFEYELQIAYVNKAQAPEIDTMFFTTNLQYAYVSSSTAKELAFYHGDVSKLVGEYTAQKLKEKFQ